jgi:hypothetical protein
MRNPPPRREFSATRIVRGTMRKPNGERNSTQSESCGEFHANPETNPTLDQVIFQLQVRGIHGKPIAAHNSRQVALLR